jgi:mannose-6-phosphate isomerase-like protein (cupin superfamily)
MLKSESILISGDEGERTEFWGSPIRFLVNGKDTDGDWSLIEHGTPANTDGPPPHIHRNMTETFYIIEGELSFFCEGKEKIMGKGSVVQVPPGKVHTYNNRSGKPALYLLHMSPGGFEDYFRELGELSKKYPEDPPFDKILELMKGYDVEVAK